MVMLSLSYQAKAFSVLQEPILSAWCSFLLPVPKTLGGTNQLGQLFSSEGLIFVRCVLSFSFLDLIFPWKSECQIVIQSLNSWLKSPRNVTLPNDLMGKDCFLFCLRYIYIGGAVLVHLGCYKEDHRLGSL